MYVKKGYWMSMLLLGCLVLMVACEDSYITDGNTAIIEKQGEISGENKEDISQNEELLEIDESLNKYRKISNKEIQKELVFIKQVLDKYQNTANIEEQFDDKYFKKMITKEGGLLFEHIANRKALHIYIYSADNPLLAFELNESLYAQGARRCTVSKIKEDSIMIEYNTYEDVKEEVTVDYIYNDLDLYVENLLLVRKSGIRIEILYTDDDQVYSARIYYIDENDRINTIAYEKDGSMTVYTDVGAEEHYKSF